MAHPSSTLYPSDTLFPGVGAGTKIAWDATDERYYQTGVDRGVLYPSGKDAVPWNGVTGVDESSGGQSSVLYIDGMIYLADVDPGDFTGQLTAFFWPDAFDECAGIPEAIDGLYVDNQKPKRFSLSYRSLIGSGLEGDSFGYQIHLIYNAVATIGNRSRKTLTDTPTPMEFSFDLVATPVALPGYRPSAHYILDTRHMDAGTLEQLENILYGSEAEAARMPTPTELYDIMNFGTSITFSGDGMTWTARGSYANVHYTDAGQNYWLISNVNGIDNGDGTFTLNDTP